MRSESGDPIRDFDIIGFSVGYEMAFPAMLEYAGSGGRARSHASERTELTPLVIAGGTAMFNCEPIADFIDIAALGEGEDDERGADRAATAGRGAEGWTQAAVSAVPPRSWTGLYVPSVSTR